MFVSYSASYGWLLLTRLRHYTTISQYVSVVVITVVVGLQSFCCRRVNVVVLSSCCRRFQSCLFILVCFNIGIQ